MTMTEAQLFTMIEGTMVEEVVGRCCGRCRRNEILWAISESISRA